MSIDSLHTPPPDPGGSTSPGPGPSPAAPRALRFGGSSLLVVSGTRTDQLLRHECLQSPVLQPPRPAPVGHRVDPAPAPDAPLPPPSRLIEEIEARLNTAPRDDVASLHGLLWSYQRLVERLLGEGPGDELPAHPAHRQWLRLREMQRRLRQHLRSDGRRPPTR